MLWDYDGTDCKSLADRVVVDTKNKIIKLVDYKTTAKLNEFKKSFYSFNYDRQLVFYTMALSHPSTAKRIKKLINKTKPFKDDLSTYAMEWYIVASDSINLNCRVFKILYTNLIEAEKTLTELMSRVKWHMENDKWDFNMEYYTGDGCEKFED